MKRAVSSIWHMNNRDEKESVEFITFTPDEVQDLHDLVADYNAATHNVSARFLALEKFLRNAINTNTKRNGKEVSCKPV